jgi:hypothetical protein
VVAALLSIAATTYFFHRGWLLLYDDEFSRLTIARRTFDNPLGFSLAQLGGVWLPWPQVQMIPFVTVRSLYFDGIAGALPSMLSYVAASVLVFKIVFHLTRERTAPAVAGAAAFMLNPNVLYMQSTAMSEMTLFAWLLGAVYGVQRFFEVEDPALARRYLVFAGGCCTVALLTRYEGWVIAAALVACLVAGCLRRRVPWPEIKANVVLLAFFPAVALVGWLLYNAIIFGNPLFFYDGPYAKPSLWSSASDPAVGNWVISLKTYLYAILDVTNWPTVALGSAGLVVLALRRRLAADALPLLGFLSLIAFFVWSLHGAQRPMHVWQINHSWYNTRFALIFAPVAAIAIGFLIGCAPSRPLVRVLSLAAVAGAVVLCVSAFAAPQRRITTLQDNLAWSAQPVSGQFRSVAGFLRAHYDGGLVLAQFFGNEGVLFESHIAPGSNVYEGTFGVWPRALANPVRARVRWIVMRTDPIDLVFRSLSRSPMLTRSYVRVYGADEYEVFERRSCPGNACAR